MSIFRLPAAQLVANVAFRLLDVAQQFVAHKEPEPVAPAETTVPTPCAVCGDTATMLSTRIIRVETTPRYERIRPITVPACGSCASRIGHGGVA